MTFCYALLLHHRFEQAERLVRRLAGPDAIFVIHIDLKASPAQVEAFRTAIGDVPRVRYSERIDARWGSFRQALAIMRVIETAADLGEAFDRCILLSGQDYPIASRRSMVEFFECHPQAEFVEKYPLDVRDEKQDSWTPFYRFRRIHCWIGRHRTTLPGITRSMPPIPLFHGSTWWALTHEAVRYLAVRFATDRRIRNYLRTGFLVDEVLVPSMLMDSPFAERIVGQNVTLAEWTPTSGPHPKTLTRDDFDTLVGSEKLFARKFDASADPIVLDVLDARFASMPEASASPHRSP